jgi:thioredoxin reductase (NADPH)
VEPVDALVVGGGPAGLSAVIHLARYDRTCVVFDAGHGRSTQHQVNHNYLGFPGGVAATELRELGRRQLAEYGHVRCVDERVEAMERDGDVFVARTGTGAWPGRTVVLCTGVSDNYPWFDAWESYCGRSMFWCVTCDGYSSRGKQILVVGRTDAAAVEALQLRRFSDRVTLLTNDERAELDETSRRRLAAAGVEVVEDRIAAARGEHGQLREVHTEGGRTLELEALFSVQGATPKVELAAQLGVGLADNGFVDTDEEQHTNVAGVFAAGDVTRIHSHQVPTAVHEGATAAASANFHLYPPALRGE